MKFLYIFLILSSASLIGMDKPQVNSRGKAAAGAAAGASRLASASQEFAANAQRVREQAERDAQRGAGQGFFEGIIADAKDLFSSGNSQRNSAAKPAAAKQKPAASPADAFANEVNNLATELNRLFEEWKQDPSNSDKRIAMANIQNQLLKKQLEAGFDERCLKINSFLIEFDKKRDAVDKQRQRNMSQFDAFNDGVECLKHQIEALEQFEQLFAQQQVPAERPQEQKPRFTNNQINGAITSLRTARKEKVNRYNRGAQIGGLAALGLSGIAIWKGSQEATGAAVVCASAGAWCAYKKYQITNLPTFTAEDGIRYLEQQQQ